MSKACAPSDPCDLFGWEMEATLKPPALPSLLTSTVPGFGVLHMLQVLRRAQLVFPQPLHVQSPGANIPAPRCLHVTCHVWQ